MATPPSFTAFTPLAASSLNSVGMWKTAAVTFTGSAGVEVQNCFNSDYSNYLVQIVYYGSAGGNTNLQYMSGTNTRDTASTYNRYGFYWTTGVVGYNGILQPADFVINHGVTATETSTVQLVVYSPNLATRTMASSNGYSGDSGLTTYLNFNKSTTTQYTGFYLFPNTGTITGKITVYGLRN